MAFLALALGLLLTSVTALAVTDPIRLEMDLSEKTFTSPADVDVAIKVTNTGDSELPGAFRLYFPDGTQVEEFGEPVLAAGESKSWRGTWHVTQEQLEEGRLAFRAVYPITGDEGELIEKRKSFAKEIVYTGGVVDVEISRTIVPTTASEGQEITVTYDVVNTGTFPITDFTITENKTIASKPAVIASIPVGEKASYTFTAKMGKSNMTSKASITYTANGKQYKASKESATIKYGKSYLSCTVTADKKGGLAGEKVLLTIKLQNSGKSDYTGVSVTDDMLGEIFSGQTVPAGKAVTLEYEVTMQDTVDYRFTVRGEGSNGSVAEAVADRLTLTLMDPTREVSLRVEAKVDHDTIYTLPGVVKFTVYVTNTSATDAGKVTVAASGVTLHTFDSIKAGETRYFVRDAEINDPGRFQFIASVRDQLNETKYFDSNIVNIAHAAPTPVPTEVPIIAPSQPKYEQIPQSLPNAYAGVQRVIGGAGLVFALLAIAGAALVVTALVMRAKQRSEKKNALASLDVPSTRNYEARHRDDDADEDDEDEDEEHRIVDSNRGMGELPSREEVEQAKDELQQDGDR